MQKESTDIRENVSVMIRVRPQIEREQNQGCTFLTVDGNTITAVTQKNEVKQFTYDYVAPENATQYDIFTQCAKPICDSVLQGYNGTIFAYGQTGSGKTYTLLGPMFSLSNPGLGVSMEIDESESSYAIKDESMGILPRIIHYLFDISHQLETSNYTFSCSFIEIYQEQMNDLLDANSNKTISIREKQNSIVVEGLNKLNIGTAEEAIELITKGTKLRHIAPTGMNKESSRSHAVFSIYVENSAKNQKGNIKTKKSVFHIIDLAGSERQKNTDAAGDRLKEAGKINTSLMQLGIVIREITTGEKHIHYRDSKLTHLLKDSLGGNSKTTIIANISPANININDTLSTLSFAQRAKMIKNNAVINEVLSTNDAMAFREEIKKLKNKYDMIKAENQRLLTEIEKTKVQQKNNAQFTKTIDSVEDEIEQMVKDLCKKDDELKQLRKENDYLKDKTQKCELDLKIKEKELKDSRTIAKEHKSNLDSITAELKDYAMKNAYMEQKVEQTQNNFSQKEAMLLKEIEGLKQTIEDNKKILELKETVVENLNNDVRTYMNIINQKDQKIAEMKNVIEAKDNQIARNQEENKILQEKIEDLNNQITNYKIQIETKNQTIKNLEIKLDEWKSKGTHVMDKYDDEIKKYKDIVKKKEEKIQNLIKKYTDLGTLLNSEKESRDKAENAMIEANNQAQTFLSTIHKKQEENTMIKEENDRLRKEKLKLLNELDLYTGNYTKNKNTMVSKAKLENTKLREEVIELRKNIENLQKCFRSTKGSPTEISNILATRENELNEARRQIHESISKMKNILNGTDFDVINKNNMVQNYLDGKTIEEKFGFYFEKLLSYIEAIEKKKQMMEKEDKVKEDNIMNMKKEINLMTKLAEFKLTEGCTPNYSKTTSKPNKPRRSSIVSSVVKADLRSRYQTKRNYDDTESITQIPEVKEGNSEETIDRVPRLIHPYSVGMPFTNIFSQLNEENKENNRAGLSGPYTQL